MTVLFADTFFASVNKLQAKETARAIEFVTRFQANPKQPGISLERLSKGGDLWSGRITQELRCIILQVGADWALLHAGHHDAAYKWAERRTVGRHPVTGMIEIVERVETVEEVRAVREQAPANGLFDEHKDDYLLSLGVPEVWLPTLRKVRDEDQLLTVAGKLPPEVAERLLLLATGEFVTPPEPVAASASPVDHPDTRRRFFVAEDSDELTRALEAPMERWVAFLHPTQRKLVQASYKGPSKVTGSAGTGKTVVGLHRARHLARAGKQVLVTSYVRTLCENIEHSLRVLCSPKERAQIAVSTLHSEALKLLKKSDRRAKPAQQTTIDALVRQHAQPLVSDFPLTFIVAEWDAVVQAQGLRTWQEYRKAKRTGRGRPLSVSDRKRLWQAFTAVHQQLERNHEYDWPGVCRKATALLEAESVAVAFDAVIVDEVQDLGRAELLFVAALGRRAPENLMVLGDAGQRIYPGGYGLSALGIDVRGRSKILRLNYRTTEQIRRSADKLLGASGDDLDGGKEPRDKTRSILSGPRPELVGHETADAQFTTVVQRVSRWVAGGIKPEAIAIFGRTKWALEKVEAALTESDMPSHRLAEKGAAAAGTVQLGTMHRAKGLEFKAVIVVGCSVGQVPNATVLDKCSDPQDRENAEAREKRLLYVAMTRARDELVVLWSGDPSPFLVPLLDE